MIRSTILALAAALSLAAPAAVPAGPATLRHLPGQPPNVNGFVLTSPQGVKVFIDANAIPDDLAAAAADPRSILLATHKHFDHYAASVADRFKGKKLLAEAGTAESGDVKVTVVPSSHLDNEVDGHTNTIVVVDLAGFRVAHFGDCGQDTLTPEQVKAIGRIDLMIGILENAWCDADLANRKAFKILAQVAPTVFIPTHIATPDAVKALAPGWPPQLTEKMELVLGPALLARGKRAVLMAGDLPLARQAGVPASPDL